MPKYKKYLLTGGPVPRSTLYYRRKQMSKLLAQQQQEVHHNGASQHQELNERVDETNFPVTTQHACQSSVAESSGHVVAVQLSRSPSTTSDSDEIASIPRTEARKRKKTKLKQKNEVITLPSSSSSESDASHDQHNSDVSNCSVPSHHSPEEDYQPECDIVHEENYHDENHPPLTWQRTEKSAVLCPCTNTTVDDILFMTLVLGLRHNLSWAAQIDVLKMFSSVYKDSKIPSTKFMFLKQLNVTDNKDIAYHIFCETCDSYLGQKTKEEKVKSCTICEKDVNVSNASNFFVSLSIESQLKNFLRDEKFVNFVLNHRFQRREGTSDEVLSDVYDGNIYKKLSENTGILSSKYNFSYTFFTDGVAFGKSSNKTIWPIYLTINELPYEERSNYFILAGVYAGSKDPNQKYFLKPFVQAANKLSGEGLSWFHEGKEVTSYVIPLCCVADSVARYMILNYQSFHATWGCTFCYKRSVPVRGGQRYTVSAPAEERTDESLKLDLNEVYQRRHETQDKLRVHRGVKGPCTLLDLNYFSITSGLVVDYMHAVLLGVVKTHTELILESTRKKMWIGMSDDRLGMAHLINTIDGRIKAIQSNSAIIRELRPLKDLALWRGSEYRSWLFYCIPCLTGLLKDKYVLHLGMLSKATYILLQKSITHRQVSDAHKLFMLYTYFFEKYFGEECMFYNVHLLSHIAKGVLDYGPIWNHNSFVYEAQNRYLLQLCKSPFSVAFQIARKFLIFKSIPLLCLHMATTERTVQFAENTLNYKKLLVRYERANDNNCILLGKAAICSLSNTAKVLLSNSISPHDCHDCWFHQRMIYKRKRYTTAAYSAGKENNDSWAFLTDGKCVIIKEILKLPTAKVVLLVQEVIVDTRPCLANVHVAVNHVKKVHDFGGMKSINLQHISEPCLHMEVGSVHYVAKIPYGCGVE